MADTFLDVAADSHVPNLSGTRSTKYFTFFVIYPKL